MTISECAALLREKDDYLLLTHARPDGDTLCSAAALCSALRRMGKQACLWANPEVTENYEEWVTPFYGQAQTDTPYVVSLDMASETMYPVGFTGHVHLSIDHHSGNSLYADDTVLDGTMAACGELVMRIIEEMCGELSFREAELLYIAISTDCGCFCFGNTNAQTFLDAAHLLGYGINNGRLNKLFFRSYSFARLKLEGMIYSSLRSYLDGKINVVVITREMMAESGATENDCDDLASLAGKVKGNVVSITVRELDDVRSKASVRSNRSVDSAAICQKLGGGGHFMAAGCTTEMRPYELADALVEAAKEQMA